MATPLRALLVEDSEDDALLVLAALRRGGYAPEFERVQTAATMRAALQAKAWDIVLSDYSMPGFDAPAALCVLQATDLALPFIIISGTVGEDVAVEALKRGADDYLLKDRLTRLGQAVSHALENARIRREGRQATAALQASERELRLIANHMPGPISRVNRDLRYLFVNDHYETTFGKPREAVVGQRMPDIIGPELFRQVEPQVRRVLAGEHVTFESHTRTAAGAAINFLVNFVPDFDREKQVVGFFVLALDITARKQAENALRLEDAALAAAANAIFITDRNGVIQYINPAFTALSGYGAAEAIGQQPTLVKSDAHGRDFYQHLWQTVLAGQVWRGQITNRHKDGHLYVSEQTIAPVKDTRGEITHFVSIQQDITARQQAEAQLREQAALLDKAHDAIIVRDLAHCVRYWNKSAERIYGWTAEEAQGRNVGELLYADKGEFQTVVASLLDEDGWAGELKQVRKDGGELIVDSSLTLVRDWHGRPVSILAINTDITDRKKLESQFLRAQRMESLGTLAGGIAHDLNNVLAPIVMAVSLLQLKYTDAEGQKLLGMLATNAQRGAQMVRQVLTFGRGGIEGERLLLQPAHIAREVGQIIQDTFPKSIELDHHLASDLWTVTGDPTQLHQVLLNLCVNARDAMPNGGRLSLRLENTVLDETYSGLNPESHPGPYVVISVTDNGTGIPPGIRDKIFDPFFTTKALGKGTGLGLSTVAALVKGHGGFVNLYSELGKGSTFKVYLPAHTSPEAAEHVAVAHSGLPHGDNELVLLVDDEEAVRHIARKTLERFGYQVMLAQHGAEAVSLYAQHRKNIAVVVTDMAMPIMDGPATIVALRSINPDVKIIGSSGMGSSSHSGMAKAIDIGVGQFIAKPYAAEALLKALHKILGKKTPPSGGERPKPATQACAPDGTKLASPPSRLLPP